MRLFLLLTTFISIYGGLHLHAFLKARQALALGRTASLGLAAFMAVMVAAPIVVRVAENLGAETINRPLAYCGYTWMGLLLLFFSASLATDIYRLAIYLGRHGPAEFLGSIQLSPRNAFFLCLFFSIAATAYGFFEAASIRTEHVTLRTAKIPAQPGRLRIVQISDVHLGVIVRENRLDRILEKVRQAQPDIVVSTGDLVDGDMDRLPHLAQMLKDVSAPFGKFAVAGNHEFYAGLDKAADFIRRAGFQMLRWEGVQLPAGINIAGVDDPAGEYMSHLPHPSEREVLAKLPRRDFTLLLKHQPVADRNAGGLFDLQLSGHVHRGQIFPFLLLVKLSYPLVAGMHQLGYGSRLYISRGSGTWGPPIRILAPPEVTVLDLIYDSHADQNQ